MPEHHKQREFAGISIDITHDFLHFYLYACWPCCYHGSVGNKKQVSVNDMEVKMSIAVSGAASLRFYCEVPASITKIQELIQCLRKSSRVVHFPVQAMRHKGAVVVTCGKAPVDDLQTHLAVFW